MDKPSKVECHKYFDREIQRMNKFNYKVQDWLVIPDEAGRLRLQINPEDSISQSDLRRPRGRGVQVEVVPCQ